MTWGSCWKQTEKISAWFLAGSGAESLERSRLLLPPCLLPGGVSPVGDIALRTPAGARVCLENPPNVRGLRPMAAERAAGARGTAEEGVKMKSASGSKVESAQTWISSAGSRIRTVGCPGSSCTLLLPSFLFLLLIYLLLAQLFYHDAIGSAIFSPPLWFPAGA